MSPVGFEAKISAGERPVAAHLLRSWVRIPPGAWIFVCRKCRVLSGIGLCDELITRPEESYRLCCVVVCDLETSRIGAPYVHDISSLRVDHGTSKSYSVEFQNSSMDLCVRGFLEWVHHNSKAAFPSVLYTHFVVMFHDYY